MYGAFDRDEDQVLRSGRIVEVSRLLESDRSVLWADAQGDSQAGKDRSRGNSQRGFLKIAKYRNSSIAIPLSTLLTACDAPQRASGRSRRLCRLLYLCAELDYLPALLRGNPSHFSLKAARDVKLDYLCHESVYCLPS